MQSHVVNVRFRLRFRDGSESVLELIPPDNFDDYLIPVFQKSVEAFYISEGTHGLHFIMETDPSKPLAELEVEAVANEIILMLLGITLEQ